MIFFLYIIFEKARSRMWNFFDVQLIEMRRWEWLKMLRRRSQRCRNEVKSCQPMAEQVKRIECCCMQYIKAIAITLIGQHRDEIEWGEGIIYDNLLVALRVSFSRERALKCWEINRKTLWMYVDCTTVRERAAISLFRINQFYWRFS